jgi:hypothetical protein
MPCNHCCSYPVPPARTSSCRVLNLSHSWRGLRGTVIRYHSNPFPTPSQIRGLRKRSGMEDDTCMPWGERSRTYLIIPFSSVEK